ncbi:MAG: M64 family metallopeptidase, partial [Dermatophilaceae bacterium]
MSVQDGTIQGTTQVFGSAGRNWGFNIVLLAEGFTATQQNAFNNACTDFTSTIRATAPFDTLAQAINVFRVNVASVDSGADDPVAAGGTGAVVRTYFDASFGSENLRRLLVCNTTTALQTAASQVPEFTVAVVVVNSPIYGGSGGGAATYSLASGAMDIAIHEMGHTVFGFADEYPYLAGGNETGHDRHPPAEPVEPNVTVNTNRATLKWRLAVNQATPLPTMSNPDCTTADTRPSPVAAGTVGTFEGAHYYHCGAYRPEYDCKMNHLGVSFCRVCRAFIRKGLPTLRVDAALPSGPKCYFFHGNRYIRVTRGEIGAGSVDPGYPASISGWGWPAGFGQHGIDAALPSGSKCYFFAGNQYIRVTRGEIGAGSVDPGYPAPISGWGWPAGFGQNGIDAALRSGSKCYFFDGNQYIRVTRGETGAGSVDPGYPAPISGWGWPAGFGQNGID